MALINFTTLFGIAPLSNPALNKTAGINGGVNITELEFGKAEAYGDGFSTNPFGVNFKSKAEIEKMAKSNPRIMALLEEYNIPLRVNMKALEL